MPLVVHVVLPYGISLVVHICINAYTRVFYVFPVRSAPQMIREKISTCTLLLISYFGHSLKRLHVRRNAVILRCDWPRQPGWSDEFNQWLRKSSTSYALVEEEIALSLGVDKWTMLSDRDYKRIVPQLYSPYYE